MLYANGSGGLLERMGCVQSHAAGSLSNDRTTSVRISSSFTLRALSACAGTQAHFARSLTIFRSSTGVDAVGLDWTVDMADARKRLGKMSVQARFVAASNAAQPRHRGCARLQPLPSL